MLYEADAVRAAQREERLLGVILEDLGPGVGASGKQYKVNCACIDLDSVNVVRSSVAEPHTFCVDVCRYASTLPPGPPVS